MKAGMKLKSAACDTEVMVIRGSDVVIHCGGAPMAAERPKERAPLHPGFSGGTMIGKRYVDVGNAVELLCIKPGQGSLAIDGIALQFKDAKPLPSSD